MLLPRLESSRLSPLLAARDVSAARRGGCFRRLISFLSETNRGCLELVKLGITTFILMIRIFRLFFIEFSKILQSFECTQYVSAATHVACSRRSNSRAREKNSRRIKKEGRLEGERGREGRKGEGTSLALSPPPPPPPPVLPVYNLTRSPITAVLYYLNAWNTLPHTRETTPCIS